MTFFSYLKYMFGMGQGNSEAEQEEFEGIDATVVPMSQRLEKPCFTTEADAVLTGEEDEAATLAQELFGDVIGYFNQSLPEFLGSTVDPERQQQWLLSRLKEGTIAHLEQLRQRERKLADITWQEKLAKAQGEIEALTERIAATESKNREADEARLSAERQKRASTTRIDDLSKQADALAAENDQLRLENQMMANKLRVASVKSQECCENAVSDDELANLREQLHSAKDRADAAEKELLEARENLSVLGEIEAKMQQYEAQQARNNERTNQLTAQIAEAQSMTERLTAEAREHEKTLAKKERRLAENESIISQKEAMIKIKAEDNLRLSQEIAHLREELAQARQQAESAQTLKKSAALVPIAKDQEEPKATEPQVIEPPELPKYQRKKRTPRPYKEQTGTLSLAAETSEEEKEGTLVFEELPKPAKRKNGRKQKPEEETPLPPISAIEESLDDTDWLLPGPPPERDKKNRKPRRQVPEEEYNPDFGYQEPPKGAYNDDAAQMTLW